MNEDIFWSAIESAWATACVPPAARRLARGRLSEERAGEMLDSLDEFIAALSDTLHTFNQGDLLAFDRILERKLYDLDRAEVQEHTDGSDDGFLYARGFIVAAGQDYYGVVHADPGVALMDMECEEICYLPMHVYEDRFGATMPKSDLSRETGSNKEGWPDL